MIELKEQEMDGMVRFNQGKKAVFMYTPLCGTCQLARQMIDIVLRTLDPIDIYQCNINMTPNLTKKWEISSVPCLVILNKSHIERKVYAMNSVGDLYELLKPLQNE